VTEPAGLTADATSKVVTGGNGNTTFTWSGAALTSGTTTITASDGALSATATQLITIPSANNVPVITAHSYDVPTATLSVSFTDADATDVVNISVTDGGGVTTNPLSKNTGSNNGTVTFVWTGAGTFDTTITANDGNGGTVTASETITINPNGPPVIGAVAYDAVTDTLTVPVTDPNNDDVTVTVTVPAGLGVDAVSKNIAPTPGSATFSWNATDFFAGGTGDTTITVNDGVNPDVTATQAIVVDGLPVAADTLYAYPMASSTTVGTPVTVLVYTGMPANPLQFLSSVGFTIETQGTYVAGTFNVGNPGGARTDTDGYWALMGPPAPGNGLYLDLGDALMPGTPTDLGGGLQRYNFAVVTQGSFAAPAALPGGGAVLYSFQLTFSAAGTYHLGFQLNDGTFDQTYYSDQDGNNFFWATLDNSNTITVN
jgi:hypothetical protein